MSVTILRANALRLPVADDSVDLVVTSPPYFGLRSYTDGGQHYDGQVGAEATPAEFVDALIAATREMVRVTKPTGSIFVNLGDKYSQRTAGARSSHQSGLFPDRPDLVKDWKAARAAGLGRMPHENIVDPATGQHVPEKSLMGLPWRYALRCIDELGLILRAEIVWSKPNGLPESVRDRVRRSHEQWFHFTLSPRYYANVDEVREPTVAVDRWPTRSVNGRAARVDGAQDREAGVPRGAGALQNHPLGKLPGSVWTIATQPLRVPADLGVDHFAAFPMEWPRRIITGWCPPGICTACGEGRRAVVNREPVDVPGGSTAQVNRDTADANRTTHIRKMARGAVVSTVTGYACACPTPDAPTRPAVVLDPFGGTGTTALVADVLGRDAVHVDLSADYCRLAQWRVNDERERARVLRVPKRPKPSGASHPYAGRRTARGRASDPAPAGTLDGVEPLTLFDLTDPGDNEPDDREGGAA